MNLLELFLGQIPEALYFSLFLIFAKKLKERRILFTVFEVLDYVVFLHLLPYNMWSHASFFLITYINLKILYGKRCQITDIFTLMIASIILIVTSAILYVIIWKTISVYIVYVILHRLLLMIIVFGFNYKLNRIQKIYKKCWNRNDSVEKKIKSTTLRSISIVVFNIMFYIISLGMCFMLLQRSRGGV